MSGVFNFSGSRYGNSFAGALKRSFSAVWAFLPVHSSDDLPEEEERRRCCVDSVLRQLLSDGSGAVVEAKLSVLRKLLEGEHSPEAVERHIMRVRDRQLIPEEEVARTIGEFSESERRKLLHFLLSLAAAADSPDEAVGSVRRIFVAAGEDEESFDRCREETLLTEERRRRIIGSGAGIAVALVVILVFIITATLLRSVIFGLILAYVLLPMEKYLERHERKQRGISYWIFHMLAVPLIPLRKLSQRLMRHSSGDDTASETEAIRRERRIIARAVAQTSLLALVLASGMLMLFSRLTMRYVSGIRHSSVSVTVVSDPAAGSSRETPAPRTYEERFSQLLKQIDERLDDFSATLGRLPAVKFMVDQVVKFLRDEKTRREIITALLKRSGGVFSLTAEVLGVIGTIISDLLLTVFFAMLFLMKLAEFCRDDESEGRKSEYLVRTVFNGNWLPYTDDVIVGEAKRIIGGIMERLRIWLRGYLTLMFVDAVVYTCVFFFLRVPYFPVLGVIAGCGILLPYVGPILSCMLTLLVTLAVGGGSGVQLAGIVAAYLLYNGVIEQFIFYPAVIGESLGLTTLETIVVVLLGAVLAGIPGMLLALPTASVLKFLIPKIHNYIRMRKVGGEGQ